MTKKLRFLRRNRRLCAILGLSSFLVPFQLMLLGTIALADDCLRDWRRAED